MFYHFSSQSIYFLCVCCCVVPAQIVVMCHARIWVLLYYSRKLHFSVAYSSSSSSRPLPQNTFGYLLLRMYAPFLSPNLPKKELLKVIEKCLFAPSRIESLKDLSRSLGSIRTMNGSMEGNVQEKHAYFFASSHVTVYRHVTQMYRSCSSPRHHFWWKEGNMWLGSYSWAAAANIQLPLTVWRKWDWPYSIILERLLGAAALCMTVLGQLEMLFWSTCSIWINTMC